MKLSRENTLEVGHNRYEADASDLGLKPGDFPPRLKTIMGNQSTFKATNVRCDGGGDVLWVDYQQVVGPLMFRLFND